MDNFYRRRTRTGKVAMVRKKSSPSGKQIIDRMALGGLLGVAAGTGYGLWDNSRDRAIPKPPAAPADLGLNALASVENAPPNFDSVRKLGINKQKIKGAIDVAARAFSFELMLAEFAREDATYQRRTKKGKIAIVRKKPLLSLDDASKISTGMTIAAGGLLAAGLYHGLKQKKFDRDLVNLNNSMDKFRRDMASGLHDINKKASGGRQSGSSRASGTKADSTTQIMFGTPPSIEGGDFS